MAKVQVTNVTVLDNPSPFQNPFQFEVTFECFEDLPEGELVPNVTLSIDFKYTQLNHLRHAIFFSFQDLEWKLVYVGSASTEEHDQILDSILVGPVPIGRHMFVFQVCRDYLKEFGSS